jgi:hypothetical protein
MRRRGSSLVTVAALLTVLWLIWQKLHIVIFIPVPWWGCLIMAILLFLAVDYILDRVLRRSP